MGKILRAGTAAGGYWKSESGINVVIYGQRYEVKDMNDLANLLTWKFGKVWKLTEIK